MGSLVFSLCFASMKDNEHWSEQKEKRMMMDLNKHSQIVLMSQTVRTFRPSLLDPSTYATGKITETCPTSKGVAHPAQAHDNYNIIFLPR